MADTDISNTNVSNLSTNQDDFSVSTATTDGVFEGGKTRWQNKFWTTYFGYYKSIADVQVVIDTKATWTMGKGIITDPESGFVLDTIKGTGKDTFNTILENMIRTYYIGGDAYAEIVRDPKTNEIINLKPLDPDSMVHVIDMSGTISHYEQKSKVKKPNKKLMPDQIFHLMRNRVADEVHGTGMIETLQREILMIEEAKTDWKKMLHRNVNPVRVWHLDTDDTSEINSFITKTENSIKNVENIYVPKGNVEVEISSVAPNATLNALPWIESLRKSFFMAAGVPEIVLGGAGSLTEASAKIAYLAYQQTIEEEQLFIEEQVGHQLGLMIELEFPASLENELLSDSRKDGPVNIDKSETTAGAGQ